MKIFFVLTLLALPMSQAFATEVEIFTDSTHPVALDVQDSNLQVHYYNLDVGFNALNSIEQQIQPGIAGVNASQAQQIIDSQQTNLKQLKGNFLVSQYGLSQYPAIVFDQREVVYGYTSLQAALKEYQTWLSSNS